LPAPKPEKAEVKKPQAASAPAADLHTKSDQPEDEVKPAPPAAKPAPEVKEVAPKKDEPKAGAKKTETKKEEKKKEQPAPSDTTTESKAEPTDRDKQIAAAIQRRAEAAGADSKPEKDAKDEVDRRIAAAVQRRTMDAARTASGIGSSGSTVAGVGPGSGVGGAVRGIEYVMYRNRMESRIKAAWAWAGADHSLRAVVRFNVTEEGKIINVKTVQSSGDASYDASVERAIRAADPLGPPPEQYRNEFGTVELEFRAEDARG
jgi:colicin import membrane protein